MVGERIALVVAPEDFLRDQVLYAAACQQLGQHSGIAEGIRQPKHLAVHAELFFIEPLAEDQLPHERFARRHIRVRLDIHCALGDPSTVFYGLFDASIQLRVVFAAHLVGGGLALDIAVLGVAVQQAQLRGKGAGGLAVGLGHRPQPCQVKVRVTDGGHQRRGAAVVGLHQRAQGSAGFAVALVPGGGRLLKVHDAGVFFEAVGDFGRPQRILGEFVHQHEQGGYVHPQLVGVLVPDAEGAVAQPGAATLGLGVSQRAGQHGAGAATTHIGEIVSGVDLKQQVKLLPRFSAAGQHVIADIVMRHTDPLGTTGAESLSVDEQRGLAAHIQRHGHGLACGFFRQRDRSAQPQIFPGVPPDRAHRHRPEAAVHRLFGRQVVHRGKALKGDFPLWAVEVLSQHALPVRNPILIFGMK